MSIARKILSLYRILQYKLFGRLRYGVMPVGELCNIEKFRFEENRGDVVHPCVRYIEEGFEGHNWWMVYTPYYGANSSMENPILCYSDDGTENCPPKEWRVYGLVNEKPEDGYNSDPTLLYKDGQLYVFWRENYEYSDKSHKYFRATYVAKVDKGNFIKLGNEILYTNDREVDAETCPTFMLDSDGLIIAYAMHLKFYSKRIQRMPPKFKKFVDQLLIITDLIGLYSQQKYYGIAIWKQQFGVTDMFVYDKTLKFQNCNKLYRPWHMDFFDWESKRYAIIQTNQCNADICLAVSEDMIHFRMYDRPLLTNTSINKMGIYKPCAGVTKNGTFYLYYTAQEEGNRALNSLYKSTIPFNELLEKLCY